ncbi:MAG: hypothetical protein IT291_11160 [Deltaproteobacteria bacterium]|nr:hypothetical protein [Deltaproteobacteria bacterium]
MKLNEIVVKHKSVLTGAICCVAFILIAIANSAAEEPDCSMVAKAINITSKLRGLHVRRKVPCRLENREQVEKYIRAKILEDATERKIINEGIAFRALGLIPASFNYLNGLVKMYVSQLGGYYDAKLDYYVMAEWIPAPMQMSIAIHELTHALQDQHYNLDSLMDEIDEPSDLLMAKAALIEGDATAVMLDYSRKISGQQMLQEDKSVSGFMMQSLLGSMFSSATHGAPPSLQAMLMFPYVSGLNFAHTLLTSRNNKGYQNIDRAYKSLPISTEQILHPDKYLAGKSDFVELEDQLPSDTTRIKSTKPIYSDRLGEFAIATLLSNWLPPARASTSATGWGGDRISVYEHIDAKSYVVTWATNWDTVSDSEGFFQAIVDAYSKRFSITPRNDFDKTAYFDTPEIGVVRIMRDDTKVLLEIGL